jgi:surfeit locus 1 family protein
VVPRVIEARRKFSPPAWATIGLVVTCGLFVWAGLWQLDRRSQKQQLFAAFDNGNAVPVPVEWAASLPAAESRYRRIEVDGNYDSRHQILLDSMMHRGRPGYHVLTPLQTREKAILVNRGWVPANQDRAVLPDVSVAEDRRRVSGRLDLLPTPGIRTASQPIDASTPWPRRLLFPTATEIGHELGYQPYEFQLLLDSGAEDGFVRDWRPAITGPERHTGYAIQWFGLALMLVIIYIFVNLKKAAG